MATTEHCLVCFEALDAHLNRRKPMTLEEIQAASSAAIPSVTPTTGVRDPTLRRLVAEEASSSSSSSTSSTSLAEDTPATSTSSLPLAVPTTAPLFVTWNKWDDNNDDDDDDDGEPSLRGCIGTFEKQDLADGLAEYALISALQDSRFTPVRKAELPRLQVAVTLLTDFEDVEDPYDWTIGTHGIRLSFHERGRRYGSTFLPDVAAEQGWTQDETLFHLVRKAGWVGSRNKWKDLDLQVVRYQGKKVSLEYSDFKKWRESIKQ